jgi:hypothetical protein
MGTLGRLQLPDVARSIGGGWLTDDDRKRVRILREDRELMMIIRAMVEKL